MNKMIINLMVYFLFSTMFFCSTSILLAQKENSQDMQILLDKVKADKKVVVMSNMDMTQDESNVFWPIYDEYQRDLGSINEKYTKIILDYADAYNNKLVTDEFALRMLEQVKSVYADETQLTETYSKKLLEKLPAIKVLRYLQIENKIRAAIKYELATKIPLIQ